MPQFPLHFTLSNGTEVHVNDTYGQIRFLLEYEDGSEHYFILHGVDTETSQQMIEGNNLEEHLEEEKEAVRKLKELFNK